MKIPKAYCFDMPNQIVEYNLTMTLEADGVQETKNILRTDRGNKNTRIVLTKGGCKRKYVTGLVNGVTRIDRDRAKDREY